VYIGSYDGRLYSFDARSGHVRWAHRAGGKISGSATIIGNVVYYSDLGTKSSAGLNVRTGQQVFSLPDGAFNAVIADYGAIYLNGYAQVYKLVPGRPAHHPRARRRSPRRQPHARRRPPGHRAQARRTHPRTQPQQHRNRK